MPIEPTVAVSHRRRSIQSTIRFHVDGSSLKSLPPSISNPLLKIGGVEPTSDLSTGSADFCGFINTNRAIHVFLPKTTDLSLAADDLLCRAKILFQSILRFSRRTSAGIVGDDPLSKHEHDSITQMQLQLMLIEDWMANGVYKNIKRNVTYLTSGRIDWKRTFTSVLPLLARSGAPIYPHFAVTETIRHSTTLIAQIHVWAVGYADANLGWLINPDGPVRLFPELSSQEPELPCSRELAERLLTNELRTQYNDRNIWLLKSLIRVLEGSDQFGRHGAYGVTKFWRVWEDACKAVVAEHNDDLSHLVPQPIYVTERKKLVRNKARQIPDILIEKDGRLYVVDAKYYDVSRTVPGWGDIVKQFYYAKSLRLMNVGSEIRNVFLFPLPKPTVDKPVTVMLRHNDSISDDGLDTEFPPISCEYLDIYRALESYTRGRKLALMWRSTPETT